MPKSFLSGNEAVAVGAYQAGANLVTGYPGTPSTEILEACQDYQDLWAEWSVNEKVALEVGLGAALAGGRALVTMKHVGLNVAADPLFSASHTGFSGALVIAVADDPGMWSSQNEQDTRHYGRSAKVPVLEPSDSQEALEMTVEAFRLSHKLHVPVILRLTTRISHTRCIVDANGSRIKSDVPGWEPDIKAQVLMPAFARGRHEAVEERLEELKDYSEGSSMNRPEIRDQSLGIITSGVAFQHVRTALPRASTLKLGVSWPLPRTIIEDFVGQVEECWVIEELDTFFWTEILAMGLEVRGAGRNLTGELAPGRILEIVGRSGPELHASPLDIPPRPPVLCSGCPHRGTFYVLNQMNALVTGDIGCYTLGALPPLSALHTCTCMGAGIGEAIGIAALTRSSRPLVAVIGDSTFVHSGMTGLANLAYAGRGVTVVLLDNRTTAMTGHQPHAGSGQRLAGEVGPGLDYQRLGEALGVNKVAAVDAWDLEGLRKALAAGAGEEDVSLVVVRGPCVLLRDFQRQTPYGVDDDACIDCGQCLDLGCPALVPGEGSPVIETSLCTGCGLCSLVCPVTAIEKLQEVQS